MAVDIGKLRARWGWATLLTILPLAVMIWLDGGVKAAAGVGILDLQFAATEARATQVLEAWRAAGVEPQIGFSLGIDYLHMTAYAFAFFYGAVAAREAFAKAPGRLRSVLNLVAWAGVAGALLDVAENAIHAGMLFGAGVEAVSLQYPLTLGKWTLEAVGVLISLGGLAGLLTGRLARR